MKLRQLFLLVQQGQSLPPRERELKRGKTRKQALDILSLPPRERELKLLLVLMSELNLLSLPPRERELKLLCA